MKWFDNKLSWNESDYGGITEIRLPYERIWKPVIFLMLHTFSFSFTLRHHMPY